ncbi:MAG: CRISPR-associated endonuclease Cas2 [Bryobacteraceae bacterium]
MLVVVAYDVNTETKEGRRRLRRVAQACQDFGQRVQKSVFECVVRESDWALLKSRLLREFDARKDNLRFYFLDESAKKRIEHHGVGQPVDLEAPLIV